MTWWRQYVGSPRSLRRWRVRRRVLDVVVAIAAVPVAIYLSFKASNAGRKGDDVCEELASRLTQRDRDLLGPLRCVMTDGRGGTCRWPRSPLCLQEQCDFDDERPSCFQPRRLRLVATQAS